MNSSTPDPKNNGTLPGNPDPGAAAARPAAQAPVNRVASAPSTPSAGPAPAATPAPPAPPQPVARPNPLAHLRTGFQPVDDVLRGFHIEATVAPEQLLSATGELDDEGFSLDTITGVDWMAQGQMEVVYDYFHPTKNLRVVVRTRIPRDNPEVPTISRVFPGANWHERETHDFFGIRFTGHPDLTPFLLPEDADYHPLRKDYAA